MTNPENNSYPRSQTFRSRWKSCIIWKTGTLARKRLAWIRSHLSQDGSVHIKDISSRYCGIGLWGPDARNVLSSVCEGDVSNRCFPYFSAQEIWVGRVPAIASSYLIHW
ncbi:MAG TPA: hypothetical protein DIU35_15320 [Candidatus Latescibacteria bacterium]|nr:hypothetical protein [Gemmatimonadota bacterium]HCR18850.1 hypothetical protein [Candidatus Latescibacterota bacterium]